MHQALQMCEVRHVEVAASDASCVSLDRLHHPVSKLKLVCKGRVFRKTTVHASVLLRLVGFS